MTKLAILIPVLRRPQNILPLMESIDITTKDCETWFIISPDDQGERDELECQNQSYITMDKSYENNGDYARKINSGFEAVDAEWYFLGADDLRFYPNWFEEAMRVHHQSGACVIGTNDLGNQSVMQGLHSTHSLVLGDYVKECGTIDEPGKILHEGYKHNFCDTEFVSTAKWRGAWSFASRSRIEHLHPDWGKAPMDEIYRIGKSGFNIDHQYFEQKRRWLWA